MPTPKDDLPYLEWTEPKSGAVVRFYADVNPSESGNLPAVVTQHAVETGSKITDHYRKDNETVSTVMYFSGSPVRDDLDADFPGVRRAQELKYPKNKGPSNLIGVSNLARAGVNAVGNALGLQLGEPSLPKVAQVLTFANPPRARFAKALDLIRRFQSEGILITVKTSAVRVENVAITNASWLRTPEHGNSGEVTIEGQSVRSVTSDVTLALPLPAEPRGLPKKPAGATGATGVDPNSAKGKSAAASMLDMFHVTIPGT